MKKVFYLKTCSTCARIIKSLNLPDDVEFQDIKTENITVKQLDQLAKFAGSYEALFSRRAKLYKDMGLKEHVLSEKDFKYYILEHYTFLSRPVIVYNDHIFIGNSAKTIDLAKAFFDSNE